MNYTNHKLNTKNHSHIIGRKDSVTGDTIQANDEVVFCAICQSVFLVDSWEYMNRTHCNQTETLDSVPIPSQKLVAKKKKDTLIFEYKSMRDVTIKQVLPSIVNIIWMGAGALSDYSLVYILPTILLSSVVGIIAYKLIDRTKFRNYLKMDTKTVRIFETGIELQNDKVYSYAQIEKIEYVKKESLKPKSSNSKETEVYLNIFLKNGEIIRQLLLSNDYEKVKPFLTALAKVAELTEINYYTEDQKELELIESIEKNYAGRILVNDNLQLNQNTRE